MNMRVCSKCNRPRDEKDFYKRSKYPYYRTQCKECELKYRRDNRDKLNELSLRMSN